MVTASNSPVTVITGGGSGIGQATALRLARNGDRVCICDLNADAVNAAAEQISADGGSVFTGVVDVRDQAQVSAWIAQVIEKYGQIDCLFSNAGVNARALVADMTLAQWSLLIDTHVTGTFNFCQSVLRHMVPRQAGAIVITSSDFAIVGVANAANYCAAKTALYSLTKSLALEFAPHIRVNAIGPGPIDTPLLRANRTQAEFETARRTFEGRLPIKRLGQPAEVAAVVDFLLSNRSAFITGQLLQPNGGQVMW
ncbi:MAG: SDR family oxidoreductase [Candidatus Binatota bacterium]|nr:SDR family oxidoreductase [Candidatus Binatota bacterium]